MKIGYDFDGVICNIMPGIVQHFKDVYGYDIRTTEQKRFNMDLPKEYDLKNINRDIMIAINHHQSYCFPYFLAIESIRDISNLFKEIPTIVSARNEGTRRETEQWLDYWLNMTYELILVESHNGKADKVKELGIEWFVEDRFRSVGQLTEVCDMVFMPDRNWNAGREWSVPNYMRIQNLGEIYDWILEDG